MRRAATLGLCGVLLAATLPSRSAAQGSVVLTVTGSPVTIPAPAIADYNNGFVVDPTTLSYNVNIAGGPPGNTHLTAVSIRSASATFGTLALSNLQWARTDVGTWNSLTTSDAPVESRDISRNSGNNWTNSLQFRCLISWTGVPPATYSANLIVTLTVTSP
jgi:hypothetical protein